jgi:hypothetical protein
MADPIIPNVSLGENSRIRIGFPLGVIGSGGGAGPTTDLLVLSGSVRESPQEVPLGCAMDGGYTIRSGSFSDLVISAKCQWTVAENPFSNPPSLIPGQDTEADVFVYPDFVNAPSVYYLMPGPARGGQGAYIADAVCNIDSGGTGGVIGYDLILKNQGLFYTPADPIA